MRAQLGDRGQQLLIDSALRTAVDENNVWREAARDVGDDRCSCAPDEPFRQRVARSTNAVVRSREIHDGHASWQGRTVDRCTTGEQHELRLRDGLQKAGGNREVVVQVGAGAAAIRVEEHTLWTLIDGDGML